jgi:hypothetical protein
MEPSLKAYSAFPKVAEATKAGFTPARSAAISVAQAFDSVVAPETEVLTVSLLRGADSDACQKSF